jgi:hypothetical protein
VRRAIRNLRRVFAIHIVVREAIARQIGFDYARLLSTPGDVPNPGSNRPAKALTCWPAINTAGRTSSGSAENKALGFDHADNPVITQYVFIRFRWPHAPDAPDADAAQRADGRK